MFTFTCSRCRLHCWLRPLQRTLQLRYWVEALPPLNFTNIWIPKTAPMLSVSKHSVAAKDLSFSVLVCTIPISRILPKGLLFCGCGIPKRTSSSLGPAPPEGCSRQGAKDPIWSAPAILLEGQNALCRGVLAPSLCREIKS
ncbi:UNVERIFIED_CONTAM: hypothetical protein K2H54_002717 [Gekko kuhli]